MSIRNALHRLSSAILLGAIAGIALAFLEFFAQLVDASLIDNAYAPGRLIELSACLMVLAVAITLGEIRDELRAQRAAGDS